MANETSQIYSSGGEDLLGLFLGGEFMGAITRLPIMSTTNSNSDMALQQFLSGASQFVKGVGNLAKNVPFMNLSLGDNLANQTNINSGILGSIRGMLRMQGLNTNAGLMSRKYWSGGSYVSYSFETIIPSTKYHEVVSALIRSSYPTDNTGVGSLKMLANLFADPAMFIDKDGNFAFEGTAFGAIIKTIGDQFSPTNLTKIAKDSVSKNDVVTKAFENAVKSAGFTDPSNPNTTDDELDRRTAKAVFRLLNDPETANNLISKIDALDNTYDILPSASNITRNEDAERIFSPFIFGAVDFVDNLKDAVIGTIVETIVDGLDASAVLAPRSIPHGSLAIKVCNSYGGVKEGANNIFDTIVPRAKADGKVNMGLKYYVESFDLVPQDHIGSDGEPLLYRLSITFTSTQIPTLGSFQIAKPPKGSAPKRGYLKPKQIPSPKKIVPLKPTPTMLEKAATAPYDYDAVQEVKDGVTTAVTDVVKFVTPDFIEEGVSEIYDVIKDGLSLVGYDVESAVEDGGVN